MKNPLALSLLALASLSAVSCGPYSREAAVVGGLIGAGTGAIVGHQSGRGLEGAAIGGAIGAGAGALIGSAQDDRYYYDQPGYYERDYAPRYSHRHDYYHHYDPCPPPPPCGYHQRSPRHYYRY